VIGAILRTPKARAEEQAILDKSMSLLAYVGLDRRHNVLPKPCLMATNAV
jgi:hypothetical protein